jgi:hypothetical protein
MLLFPLSGDDTIFECVIKMQIVSLAQFYTLLSTSAVAWRVISTSDQVETRKTLFAFAMCQNLSGNILCLVG